MFNSQPPFPITPILRRVLGALFFACFLFAPASIRAQSTVDDVPLVNTARIRGTVVDSQGKGIPNIRVELYRSSGFERIFDRNASTDSAGKFTFSIPDTANYYLLFEDYEDNYLDEYYNDKSTLAAADGITLAEDEVRNITVVLRTAPYITGTVTDEQGNPIEGVSVFPNAAQSTAVYAVTDADGHYMLGPLEAKQYPINFYKFGYIIEEFYKDQTSAVDADLVDLTNVDSAVVDATVTHYGYFSGYVTDLNGEPLEDTFVEAYYLDDDGDWESSVSDSAYTDENGYYQIVGNPNYEYRIGFLSNFSRHPDHFAAEYYPNEPTLAEGRSITVPVQSMTSNINATLRLTREVEADFSGVPLTGTLPLTVDFTDRSQGGILNNVWDFGDGGTSTAINASHTYTTAGVYTVTLAVTGAANTHTMTQTSYITVADVPIVDLQLTQSTAGSDPAATPMVGEMLYFSATAGGTGVQYLWDFGDEPAIVASVATTATGQYVQHTYTAAGTYTVTLTASNSEGEEVTSTQVTVAAAPSSGHNLFLPSMNATAESLRVAKSLAPPHTISGTVTNIHGQPIPDITVELYKKEFGSWSIYPYYTTTDENGLYSLNSFSDTSGLDDGQYRLYFHGNGYFSEYYNNENSLDEADSIILDEAGETFIANAVLNRRGIISGTVTDISGIPIENVDILVYVEQDGEWVAYQGTRTNEFGNYRYHSDIKGNTNFRFRFNRFEYVQEFYNDSAMVEEGQTIAVSMDFVVPNIDIMLRKHDEVEADFSGAPRTGVGSLTTDFANLARGDVITQTWDFGDGMTSTEISPTHTYTQAGVYTVTLTVVGPQNRHMKSASGYISVTDVPIMDLAIEMDEQVGTVDAPAMVGETLHFSATAGGTGVQYLWDFGDEPAIVASVATTATGQYVQHAYTAAGTYTVTLTASNSEGEQTTTHEVTVIGAPSAESTLLLPKLER